MSCDASSVGILANSDEELQNFKRGAELALDAWNSANPDCSITMLPILIDRNAEVQWSTKFNDANVLGVVGGTAFTDYQARFAKSACESGHAVFEVYRGEVPDAAGRCTLFRIPPSNSQYGGAVAEHALSIGPHIAILHADAIFYNEIADGARKRLGTAVFVDNVLTDSGAVSTVAAKRIGAADAVLILGEEAPTLAAIEGLRKAGVMTPIIVNDNLSISDLQKLPGEQRRFDSFVLTDAFDKMLKDRYGSSDNAYGALMTWTGTRAILSSVVGGARDATEVLEQVNQPAATDRTGIGWSTDRNRTNPPYLYFVIKDGKSELFTFP